MAEAQTRTRRSPRRPAAVNRRPEEGQETTLHDDIIDLFALKAKAAECAKRLGLEFEYRFTGYGDLKSALKALN